MSQVAGSPISAHDATVDPAFHYAKTPDGAYIAYLVAGDGPVDIVWQPDWPGNVDMEWLDPLLNPWFSILVTFSRLILHDHRGVGLSSRNVAPPNLETRVSDLLCVLDDVDAERPVLAGVYSSGATNALLAATQPERVGALVWIDPTPRYAWAPDYPWGRSEEDLAAELSDLRYWGTPAYGRAFIDYEASQGSPQGEAEGAYLEKMSRNACTPDVAHEVSKIWAETDVRDILPAISVPTLLVISEPQAVARSEYVASVLPGAEVVDVVPNQMETTGEALEAIADEIRRFVGAERPHVELDTILATILFTDIVGSTAKQAAIGDRGWKVLVERHHKVIRDALEHWYGVENDTSGDGFYATFDGPARPIRCALEATSRVRELGLEIRAGIHTGECEVVDGKCAGITVSTGARIAGKARPSEVFVSQTVKDLVAGSGFEFRDTGEHDLKGVPQRRRLYSVIS